MRLAEIEKEFAGHIVIQWKSFLLRPEPRPVPIDRFRDYTRSWLRVAEHGGARFRPWSTSEPPPKHSLPPNVAVKAAARLGGFERYHLALMDAYFYRNLDVTARRNLVQVAAECGLDTRAFEAALEDPRLRREVEEDHREALERGVTGVPTLVAGEIAIPGAQSLDFYRHLVRRCLQRAGERP